MYVVYNWRQKHINPLDITKSLSKSNYFTFTTMLTAENQILIATQGSYNLHFLIRFKV